jgi:hypothetical protein
MVCHSTPLAVNSSRQGPLARLLGAALLVVGAVWTGAARADALGPPALDFFFDLVGDGLAEADPIDGQAARRMLIAGIPLTIDARENEASAERRMTAGAKGQYSLYIADAVAVVGQARIAGTEFVDAETPGMAVASAGADFRYATRGWKFGFKPGFEALHEATGIAREDSILEGRLSKAIGGGLSLAATGRYRWRESFASGEPDRQIAAGRVGFASQLPHDMRLDLAYVGRQEVAIAGPDAAVCETIRSLGPSIALALPLHHSLDLSANYDFTAQTRYVEAADGQAGWRTQDELHRLNLALSWALGGDPDAMQLSAAYRYEHGGADQPEDERHAGTVSLAVFF